MATEIPAAIKEYFNNSQIALTLTDPTQEDDPLVLANAAFYRMSGYEPDEILGRNCRFLQGKSTSDFSLKSIRGDFAAQRDSKVLLRNYRKSGEEFDNFLYIFSLYDNADQPVMRIGSQFEVPRFNRAKAFQSHAELLRDGLEEISDAGEKARLQMVHVGESVGKAVRNLLMARLDHLRSA